MEPLSLSWEGMKLLIIGHILQGDLLISLNSCLLNLSPSNTEQGVDAAVAVPDHLRHLPRHPYLIAVVAWRVVAHQLQGAEEACDVRQPAAEEHHHHHCDQMDGLLLGGLAGQERPYDLAVAEDHDDQWDRQAQDVHFKQAEDPPPMPVIFI